MGLGIASVKGRDRSDQSDLTRRYSGPQEWGSWKESPAAWATPGELWRLGRAAEPGVMCWIKRQGRKDEGHERDFVSFAVSGP